MGRPGYPFQHGLRVQREEGVVFRARYFRCGGLVWQDQVPWRSFRAERADVADIDYRPGISRAPLPPRLVLGTKWQNRTRFSQSNLFGRDDELLSGNSGWHHRAAARAVGSLSGREQTYLEIRSVVSR